MKKLLRGTALLLAVLCLVTGCSQSYSATRSLEKMLDALGQGRYAKAEKWVAEGTLNISPRGRREREFYRRLFASISYTVTDTQVSGDTAQVTVKVTMIDLEALLEEVSLDVLEGAFSGDVSSKKFYRELNDRMRSGNVTYMTNTVAVILVKSEGDWKVSLGNSLSFVDAITGRYRRLMGH